MAAVSEDAQSIVFAEFLEGQRMIESADWLVKVTQALAEKNQQEGFPRVLLLHDSAPPIRQGQVGQSFHGKSLGIPLTGFDSF